MKRLKRQDSRNASCCTLTAILYNAPRGVGELVGARWFLQSLAARVTTPSGRGSGGEAPKGRCFPHGTWSMSYTAAPPCNGSSALRRRDAAWANLPQVFLARGLGSMSLLPWRMRMGNARMRSCCRGRAWGCGAPRVHRGHEKARAKQVHVFSALRQTTFVCTSESVSLRKVVF